ncbi:hypothetical protein KHQ88_01510 [Mycoplasmatota bacterium]|nr:hypothetical protein KHQ88_01510 [Mycoplasmatota bacterium]
MKYEDIQKLNFILEDDDQTKEGFTNQLSKKELDQYLKSSRKNTSKEKMAEHVFHLWEKDHEHKSSYEKMMVKNSIINQLKNGDKHYVLMVWWFVDNGKPFFIDIKHETSINEITNTELQTILETKQCEYTILKKNLSELKAEVLKKQIIYYYHVKGLALMNHKELI